MSILPKFLTKKEMKELFPFIEKYYYIFKKEFLTLIKNPKNYPLISYEDFEKNCDTWEIYDRTMNSLDI